MGICLSLKEIEKLYIQMFGRNMPKFLSHTEALSRLKDKFGIEQLKKEVKKWDTHSV